MHPLRRLLPPLLLLLPACQTDAGGGTPASAGPGAENPFLVEPATAGKTDTGYYNPEGIEVEVDLEGHVKATEHLADAPGVLAEFAQTDLRRQKVFYVETLAEDAATPERVEWLIDGKWVPNDEAEGIADRKKTHWRLRGVDAVLLASAAKGAKVGSEFTATVPVSPYTVMDDAGERCMASGASASPTAGGYWYYWDADATGCDIETQALQLTVTKLGRPADKAYPEWDRLSADGLITAVVLFGQIDDGPLTDRDIGMEGYEQMRTWLADSGYVEHRLTVGTRFETTESGTKLQFDLLSPKDFKGLNDKAHLDRLQKAVSSHEIVVFDGHTVPGGAGVWASLKYPDMYQIVEYGGCLGYEEAVQPILAGKGSWDNLDVVSSVELVMDGANNFGAPLLAQVQWAARANWGITWADILKAIHRGMGDGTFGVSGVRDNCFTPEGGRCGAAPSGDAHVYAGAEGLEIPDGSARGKKNTIDVSDEFDVATTGVTLEVTHGNISDLKIVLTHAGVEAVLWDHAGAAGDTLDKTFRPRAFKGLPANGAWTLKVVDDVTQDTGTVEAWSLTLK